MGMDGPCIVRRALLRQSALVWDALQHGPKVSAATTYHQYRSDRAHCRPRYLLTGSASSFTLIE